MVNIYTAMVNLKLNVALRSLATSTYNISFLFFYWSQSNLEEWKCEEDWNIKQKQNFKKILKHLANFSLPKNASENCIYGKKRCLWDFKFCRVACIACTQIKDILYTILKQEVHNILETKFHKNFTSKKKVVQNIILLVKSSQRVYVAFCLKDYSTTF